MAQSETHKKSTNGSVSNARKQAAKTVGKTPAPRKGAGGGKKSPDLPGWLAPVMSVIGVGLAVGAGLYATRHQWMTKAGEYKDDFSAAFADDETDSENFDQTRHAGADSMRDDQPEDWNEVDDMSDASFPASDPPSFTPGTAS